MGGNVMVDGIQATSIDLRKINRNYFVETLCHSLGSMNREFYFQFGKPIWNDSTQIWNGSIFSGSSKHLMDLKISEEELILYKPIFGDIDVQVNKELTNDLSNFLKEGSSFGSLVYRGRSKTSIGQISCLFDFLDEHDQPPIQIDFEFVDIDKETGLPTRWERFAHSVHWSDVKFGIKGVFHKFLIGSIDFANSHVAVVLNGKKKAQTVQLVHDYAFSVHRGLRKKYKTRMNGILETIPEKERIYTTNIDEIFFSLFGVMPSRREIKLFRSFKGCIKLIQKYFRRKQQEAIFDEFLKRTFGKKAQKLYRDDPTSDLIQKTRAILFLASRLTLKEEKEREIQNMIEKYYNEY